MWPCLCGPIGVHLSSDFYSVLRLLLRRKRWAVIVCHNHFWRLCAVGKQHILNEHYRRFWTIDYQYPNYFIFSNFVHFMCISRFACLLVRLYLFNGHEFMSPFREITAITGDSVSARIVNCTATWIVAYSCTPWLHALCGSMLDIMDRFLYLCKIGDGAECISTIFLSMGKILLMKPSMYDLLSEMSTAGFPTTPIHGRPCKLSNLMINRILPCTWIDSFVAARSLGHEVPSFDFFNAGSAKLHW